jgi:hypothetical protein
LERTGPLQSIYLGEHQLPHPADEFGIAMFAVVAQTFFQSFQRTAVRPVASAGRWMRPRVHSNLPRMRV